MTNEIIDELKWRDLSAEDVYHIAHLENEMRYATSKKLGDIAFEGNISQIKTRMNSVQLLIDNHETRAETWLADQALIRGLDLDPEIAVNIQNTSPYKDKYTHVDSWLNEQFQSVRPGEMSAKSIAKAAGVSEGYLSGLRTAKRGQPSQDVMTKLANAFADVKGLSGKERKEFIEQARQYAKL